MKSGHEIKLDLAKVSWDHFVQTLFQHCSNIALKLLFQIPDLGSVRTFRPGSGTCPRSTDFRPLTQTDSWWTARPCASWPSKCSVKGFHSEAKCSTKISSSDFQWQCTAKQSDQISNKIQSSFYIVIHSIFSSQSSQTRKGSSVTSFSLFYLSKIQS